MVLGKAFGVCRSAPTAHGAMFGSLADPSTPILAPCKWVGPGGTSGNVSQGDQEPPADLSGFYGVASLCGVYGRPSETLGQPVVRLVPTQLLGEAARRRAGVDHGQLGARHLRQVPQVL